MTLEQAIEMLDRIVAQDWESGRPDCVKAEKLGIEALERVRHSRMVGSYHVQSPLPSETDH